MQQMGWWHRHYPNAGMHATRNEMCFWLGRKTSVLQLKPQTAKRGLNVRGQPEDPKPEDPTWTVTKGEIPAAQQGDGARSAFSSIQLPSLLSVDETLNLCLHRCYG